MARVADYMSGQSAGQCGPCVHGLAELSGLLHDAAYSRMRSPGRVSGIEHLRALCDLVEGRGACKHPDGVARMVASACNVFGEHLAAHLTHGPCPDAARSAVLPVPPSRRTGTRR